MGRRLGMVAICAAVCATFSAVPANAAFPGENGKIAFVRGGNIWTVNPDGTARTQITTSGSTFGPRWSPDGSQIVFTALRANADPGLPGREWDVWIMDADGSDKHQVTDTPSYDYKYGGSWSPDGSRIAYGDGRHIWTVKPDGTDTQRVTQDPVDPDCYRTYGAPIWSPDGTSFATNGYSLCFDHEYTVSMIVNLAGAHTHSWFTSGFEYLVDWSPDSHQVLFGTDGPDSGMGMYTVNLDGGGNQLTDGSNYDGGAWSPDGSRIVLSRATNPDFSDTRLYLMDAEDGSNLVPLSAGDANESGPDWQPIPVNAYPRPKGASPTRLSLVPAYEPCTSANSTHGPPLAFGSCNPPARVPGQLTIGTFDANGQPAKSVSYIRINPIRGNPATPADEADVRMRGTINDVRLASDLSDYTGNVQARLTVQITDRNNTPSPGGPGAATVQEFTHSQPLTCAATADTTVGATCDFDTTVEALVPGAVKEQQRAVWQLDAVRVHDGAGNLFLTQGIFVP